LRDLDHPAFHFGHEGAQLRGLGLELDELVARRGERRISLGARRLELLRVRATRIGELSLELLARCLRLLLTFFVGKVAAVVRRRGEQALKLRAHPQEFTAIPFEPVAWALPRPPAPKGRLGSAVENGSRPTPTTLEHSSEVRLQRRGDGLRRAPVAAKVGNASARARNRPEMALRRPPSRK
jgi:hypothetical protein